MPTPITPRIAALFALFIVLISALVILTDTLSQRDRNIATTATSEPTTATTFPPTSRTRI